MSAEAGTEDQQDVNVTGASGTEEEIDWSTYEIPQEQPEVTGQATETQTGDNPKWKPFLETIPAPFHDEVKKHLREWDQGINQRFQEKDKEWEPFKKFREQQIAPERLEASYQLSQRLATDPLGFYEDLKQALVARGAIQEAQQVQDKQDAIAAGEENVEENVDDPYLQQITELKQRLDERDRALAEFAQTQQQEEEFQQAYEAETANIENGFKMVESKTGPLSDAVKGMIVEKALVMNQQLGRAVSIEEAAPEVLRALAAARRVKPAPPRGIPPGGSIPQTPVQNPQELDRAGRFSEAEKIRQRILAENQ